MKKNYLIPETTVSVIFSDAVLMASLDGASGQDVIMQEEADFDTFFNS